MAELELSDTVEVTVNADGSASESLLPLAGGNAEDYDLTLVFPLGGDSEDSPSYTEHDFVKSMLGLRSIREKDPSFSPLSDNLFMHTASRILKTSKCFADDSGRHRMKSVVARQARGESGDPDLPAGSAQADSRTSFSREVEKQRREMMSILADEYKFEIGHSSKCTEKQFHQLVARTIVRRIQLTCGLEARMFLSVDGDEIICTVKADAEDLMTEADRIDYKVQTLNMPFGMCYPERKYDDKKGKVEGDQAHEGHLKRANELAQKHLGQAAFRKSQQEMREICGGSDRQPPHMDPLLASEGKHQTLRKQVKKMGHRESHASDPGAEGVYLAPYVAFNKKDEHIFPYYRIFNLDMEEKEKGAGIFRPIDRVRLVGSIMQRHINLPSLMNQKLLVDYFAPHQDDELQWMRENWAKDFNPLRQLQQPIGRVRNYFGEKIAMYFAWLEYYARALFVPAIVGVVVFIMNFADGSSQGFSLIFYGGFVSLWATLFCEFWTRRNAFLNLWWGTSDFKQQEQERPAFIGKTRLSPVNDEFEVAHVAKRFYYAKLTTGACVVFLLICCVIGAISGIFIYKNQMSEDPDIGPEKAATYAGLLNAVQIQVLNIIYRKIAISLNDWENHRTDSDYENNLIAKTFLFQFVNSYASFFYIAFLKRSVERPAYLDIAKHKAAVEKAAKKVYPGYTQDQLSSIANNPCLVNGDGVPDCVGELRTQLGTIFVTRLVVGNLTEIGIPMLKFELRKFMEKRSLGTAAQTVQYIKPEREAKLNRYEEMESFDDYAEMVLQYGFVTLFVVAFPVAPLLAFINNVAEIHVDAVKLCYGHRRPWPRSATSIGTWSYFLSLMSTLSVMTNIALLIFTAEIKDLPHTTGSKWLMFMIAEHLLLVGKKMVQDFVPDVPHFAGQILQRHKWLEQRVFYGLQVESDDHLREKAEELDLDSDKKLAIHANPSSGATHFTNPAAAPLDAL